MLQLINSSLRKIQAAQRFSLWDFTNDIFFDEIYFTNDFATTTTHKLRSIFQFVLERAT